MKPPQPTKKRVTIFTWIVFGTIFVPCDLVKLPLLLVDFIPIIGTATGSIAAFILSIIENGVGYPALYLTGLYRKSPMSSVMLSAATLLLDFIPGIDDIPFTSPSVLFVISKAKAQDKIEEKEYQKAIAAYNAQLAQQVQLQRQYIQAANDNEAAREYVEAA